MFSLFGLTIIRDTALASLVNQAGAGNQLALGVKALSLIALDPDCQGKLARLHEGYKAFASGDHAALQSMLREWGT